MNRKELLKSNEYWIAEIQLNLFNLIEDYRIKHGLKKKDLAEKLKVTKGYITQVLNGNFDHKISKLVELALAFDKIPVIAFLDVDKFIAEDKKIKRNLSKHHPRKVQPVKKRSMKNGSGK